ncbi:class I SAM-dependent methyltransferase [Flavobacterium humi]|uniref:S-adenosyl-L-methionine-dependent methyltransferase n=1 Tax=Flavobacterium humi TaxID=2562683 RepID=A0A4Z0L7L4_9FLAO|nr:SAM-dependent methyltransferase [Flavobacterium humi]TGD58002.1 SAM-dependent methyltransferase [Flavobacterium humi]
MKIDKASRTAQYMALFRALETRRNPDDRLFTDPYAIHFLDRGLRVVARASKIPVVRSFITRTIQKKIPGAFSSGLARTKYIDELLQQNISGGTEQVLILGAGFDTRAMRLDFLKQVPVIEIDHPNTSNFKIGIFRQRMNALPGNVTFCQIDFNTQSLDELAATHHFDFTKPTTIIWEGVTNYLTAEAVGHTFAFLSKFPKDSAVIFTYVHQQVLDEPGSFLGGEKLLKDLETIEERWTFGFLPKDLASYLSQYGFTLAEDLGAAEYRNNYLPKRNEEGYEFYRVAVGKK